MKAWGFWSLGDVSDSELQGRLKELLRSGSRTEALIVAHLAEVAARRLHLHGAPSLFQYCLVDLGFSESEAWYRICAARAARRFPLIFELLEKRELHLTAVALLSKHLTAENHRELLAEARGQTKQQILESLARRWPKAEVSSHVRRIPSGAVGAGPTGTLKPRSADAYCLQLNASPQLKAKLEQARDLMSHANPSGDLAVVVERALDVLIQKLKGRHFGQTGKPKADGSRQSAATSAWNAAGAGIPGGAKECKHFGQTGEGKAGRPEHPASPRKRRHIRQEVRRQVAERDEERCCHVSPDGERCDTRAFLQLHHEQPWALGGADSADNLRLLCRSHNRLKAELEMGAGRVEQAIERRRASG
jgi:hypothetical protein